MEQAPTGSFWEKYLTPIAVLLGALIIAGALAYGRGDAGPSAQTGNQPVKTVDIKDVKTSGSPSIGNANAPATLAVWFDYQCGYCKRFDAETLSALKASHVDTGKLRIVFKDFQFFPGSEDVGVFGRAVYEAYPDRHYAWFSGMMALPAGESGLTVAKAKEVATAVGLDAARIEQLATQNRAKYLAAVQADKAEGTAFGITGTPASIVGKQLLEGAQPLAAVTAAVEAK
ncbi:MAG TPA: thioredoxin domain-containing protein [Candidatus Paceibacterota bacterium]|nr:thioredoxin domain-containing protein [Candidatus Paceibacterota bacterium]